MPGADYYAGLSLADALERFAETHADPDTRHISQSEFDLLQQVVEVLRRAQPGTE